MRDKTIFNHENEGQSVGERHPQRCHLMANGKEITNFYAISSGFRKTGEQDAQFCHSRPNINDYKIHNLHFFS